MRQTHKQENSQTKHKCGKNPEDKNKLKLVLLNEFLEQKNITNIQELQYNSEYLKELAVTMNKRYKFTQKEIAELVGLSRLKIHRLMNE